MAVFHDTKMKASLSQLLDHAGRFDALVQSLDDDVACFTSMALILYDMVNGQLPEDPVAFLAALNDFMLNQQAGLPAAEALHD